MMSRASFKVFYCGPALESGQMDVRELAPALLAIGDLLEETNRVLNERKTAVSVRVNKFEDGSFGISIDVVQSFVSQIVEIFSGDNATAAVNMLEFLGLSICGARGLLGLIKNTKGKKPERAKTLIDGNIELVFADKKVLVSKPVFELYRDLHVRKEIENVLKPLEREGIDGFKVQENTTIIESVNKDEAKYFKQPEVEDEIIQEQDTIATYSIHTLSFKEDNKWRLTDGTSTFFVTIKDDNFLRKVQDNLISFSQGDLLELKLHVTTWETATGIKTEYEATEVISHKSAAKQLKFDFE